MDNTDKSSVGAIVLIVIGVLFLLNNLGILPWTLWITLWRFWPVLLVLFGLKLILGKGKNHEAFTFISLLIVLLVLLFSIATVNSGMRSWMQSHMPWFPMNQMMQDENQNPWGMMQNRRFRMNLDNGNQYYFNY